MTVWSVVLWIVAIYLLIGTFSAYMNFYLAESRKKITQKIQDLRKRAFRRGITFSVELRKDLEEIGFDEDEAYRSSPTLRSPAGAAFSVGTIKVLIAVALTFVGPFYLKVIWQEYQSFRDLRGVYESFHRFYLETCHQTGIKE